MVTQRGRRSTAQLSVITIPGQRHEPPRGLTKPQAAVWRSVVATKPSDWFSVDTHPLLAAYCRHTATADVLAAKIDAIETEAADCSDYKTLLSQRDRETAALLKLAQSMRLTQYSRFKSETAATQAANSGDGEKPWSLNV
jgi:hypothetical protein